MAVSPLSPNHSLRLGVTALMSASNARDACSARSERELIVTFTSGMGSLADNTSGGPIAYRNSKAAVVMRSLAPRGITCVVLNPGWVQTDIGGVNATLSPAESVTALRQLIKTLGPAQSGKFFNYDSSEYAW